MKRWIAAILLATGPALAQDAEPELVLEPEEQLESFEYEEEEEEEEEEPPAPPVWTKQGADGTVHKTLSSERLRFCNDPDYRVPQSERWLCELGPEAKARCPAFEAACKNPPAASGTRTERRRRRELDPSEDPVIKLPESVAALATLAFWALVVVGGVALVALILKHAFGRREEDETIATPGEAPPEEAGEPGRPRPAETNVDRLLARARAAAARGDFGQGVGDAYAALLHHLDSEGLVHLHPAATNGDFVRGLREHPDMQRGVRAVVRDVDRLQFGAAQPTAELFDRVLARVTSLVARGATLALVLFGALGCEIGDDAEGRVSADSPAGYSVLIAALESRDATVRSRIEPLSELSDEIDLMLVLERLEDDEWNALRDWIDRGGVAVLAVDPAPASGWLGVTRSGMCSGPYAVDEVGGPFEPAAVRAPGSFTFAVDETRPQAFVVARCQQQPIFVDVGYGSGRVLVLDSGILTNASLAVADNAYVVLNALGEPKNVEIVDQWTGSGSETPFAAVQNARLGPALGQLFALLLLAFLARGWPFGKLREPPEKARRAFADHVRALGVQYAKARASRLVLGVYAGWALDRLKARAFPSSRTSLLALSEAIAARTGRDERDVVKILLEAEAARDEANRSGTPAEDLALMKELEGLLVRSGGEGWTSTGSKIVTKS